MASAWDSGCLLTAGRAAGAVGPGAGAASASPGGPPTRSCTKGCGPGTPSADSVRRIPAQRQARRRSGRWRAAAIRGERRLAEPASSRSPGSPSCATQGLRGQREPAAPPDRERRGESVPGESRAHGRGRGALAPGDHPRAPSRRPGRLRRPGRHPRAGFPRSGTTTATPGCWAGSAPERQTPCPPASSRPIRRSSRSAI